MRVEPAVPAPVYGQQFDGSAGESGDARQMVRRLVGAVLRYKWAVLALTLVGTAGGYVASRSVAPQYVAQATVWIEGGRREGGADRGPIRSEQLLASFGWVDLLRSYVVLDEVVHTQRLYLSLRAGGDSALFSDFALAPRFAPGDYTLSVRGDGTYELRNQAGPVDRGQLGDSIGRPVGFLWQPRAAALTGSRTVEFHVTTPRDAAQTLGQGLDPRIVPEGNFLRVALTGTNPVHIATTVNAVVERYVTVAADLKREKLRELTRILNEQLQYAARNLQNAERALESYRVQTITLPTDRATPVTPGLQQTRDPVFSNFFDMNIRREQLRRDREAIEQALVAAGADGVSADALSVVGEVQQSTEVRAALQELTSKQAELRALRYRYTEAHPPVRRLAAEVDTLSRQTIPALARQLVQQIGVREAELSGRVTSASRELQQIPPRVMEEARLSREKAIAENLYTTLQSRYEEARLAEASSIPDVRILDRASTPRRPTRNTAWRLIVIGLVGSLGLGIAGAVVLDRFDPRLRYPEQVTAGMGLTILGAVPHVRKNGKSKTDTLHVLEALRGVRLNLIHAYGTAGPLVVTITSPGSGDGKSFLSSNLALCFADNGARTLLVDGDVRRGRLHALMNVTRKPGLTDFLAGEATRDKIIHQTNYPFLSLVTCGTRRRNGPELLGSPAMAQLMATLRSSYDVILVDSPPLGAGVDPFVLGTLTGHMMLVLRTGVTDREYTEAKLDMLDRLPVRVLGAVLNDVRAGDAYGYYAYYTYLPGYEATDERGEAEPARQLPGQG
jgi:tyrosine-protein kinase Etk/Wzc